MSTIIDTFEIISRYTRSEAIEDGVLVNVTKTAREAGFVVPVAITRNLWDTWVEPPEKMKQWGQCASGRRWDILWMLKIAAKTMPGDCIMYEVLFQNTTRSKETVRLVSKIGPGDLGEPVITIMLPGDD